MNDPALVAYMAEIAAIQAEVEGMKSTNTFREMRGETIAYAGGPFFDAAEKLLKISEAIGNLYSRRG